MTTTERNHQPLMRTCSSTQPTAGHCGMETYEQGKDPLCWWHRKTLGERHVATWSVVNRGMAA